MAGKLLEQGFRNVSALKGGYAAWRKAEYPLEIKSPEPEENQRLPPASY